MRSGIEKRHTKYAHQNLLPTTFEDKEGTMFNAKADNLIDNIYVELKEESLNKKTSVKASYNALRTQYNWKFKHYPPESFNHHDISSALWNAGNRKDCLDNAWNHSLYKHKIVSDKLKSEGYEYWIVFAKHPSLIEKPMRGKGVQLIPFKDYYKKYHNLTVMLESEYLNRLERLEGDLKTTLH